MTNISLLQNALDSYPFLAVAKLHQSTVLHCYYYEGKEFDFYRFLADLPQKDFFISQGDYALVDKDTDGSYVYIHISGYWASAFLTTAQFSSLFEIDNIKLETPLELFKIEGTSIKGLASSCPTVIAIPTNITTIGDAAFARCDELESIIIPDSVTSIRPNAFFNCSSLTTVAMGNSVTNIGDRAFSYCSRLTNITIPNSVRRIGNAAFYGCSNLTNITIPDGVTSIGNNVFGGCELRQLTLPRSLTHFDANSLWFVTKELKLVLPNSITLQEFLAPLTSPSSINYFKRLGSYEIVLQGVSYTNKELADTARQIYEKKKKAVTDSIPPLYRVKAAGNHILTTTTYDKKQNAMRVHYVDAQGMRGSYCPLFFASEQEADACVIETFKNNISHSNDPVVYQARLSYVDQNFTKIQTVCGPALVQSAKKKYIDPSCILEEDIF